MMNLARNTLCLLLAAANAHAAAPLQFSAEVQDENLAEEAILLAHCLAERAGGSWEYSAEAGGQRWIKVREENRKLRGTYHKETSEQTFDLIAGGSDAACDRLEPAASSMHKASKDPALSPLLTQDLPAEQEEPARKTWLWVGLGLAAVGGFFFWRARQPQFNQVEMR